MHLDGSLHVPLGLPFQRCIDLGGLSSFYREEMVGNPSNGRFECGCVWV